MKMRNKGKVHPSPSSENNTLSVLNLLPAAILAIASVLSLEDREVLAYMVTRSITTPSSDHFSKKKYSKKVTSHKPPLFDCECFDCYTCYWFKWDSSPNRELIHQVIEAFEDHLTKNELSKGQLGAQSVPRSRRKNKDKAFRRNNDILEDGFVHVLQENADVEEESGGDDDVAVEDVVEQLPETTVMLQGTAVNGGGGHKGLARKVLPDVLGLFNSRLWNLWSPNV